MVGVMIVMKNSARILEKGLCDDASPADWAYATETNGNMKITIVAVLCIFLRNSSWMFSSVNSSNKSSADLLICLSLTLI